MRFQCSHCNLIVAIDDAEMGQPVGCGHCGNITFVPKTPVSPNAVIGDFVIKEVLGHGGMGTVYLAHQISLDRPVALKILMEQFSRDSEFIVDFIKEARAAARLNHPNIVQSYAVGEEEGVYFFAMEYVKGRTLKRLMDEQEIIPVERGLSIGQQIADALDFAWKNQKLVHRDIKPDNIMLTAQGVAKLADLGLARVATELLDDDDDEVMGTPQYICPEQLLGQPLDVRCDIYSLGATLFHAITGRFPFEGRTAADIAKKHLQADLTPPSSIVAEIPVEVDWIIAKMMARRIQNRYQDAASVATDLGKVLRGEPPVGYTSKPATGTKPAGAAAALAPAAVPPPLPPSAGAPRGEAAPAPAPAAKTGTSARRRRGRTMRIKPRKKSMRMRTDAVASATGSGEGDTSVAAAPPAAPRRGGGVARLAFILLCLVALVVVGVVGVGLVVYRRYTPRTANDAARMYWKLPSVSAGEREAYARIKPYMGQVERHESDPEVLNEVATQCQQFLNDYPQSLFARNADDIDYARMFRAPAYFRNHLARVAAPLAGSVRETMGNFEEAYVRLQRQAKHEEEQQEVEKFRYQGRIDRMHRRVTDYVQDRIKALNARADEFRTRLSEKEQRFEAEQDEVYREILDLCHDYEFDKAIRRLKIIIDDTKSYGEPIDREVALIVAKREPEAANVFLHELARDSDLKLDLIAVKFEEEIKAANVEELKLALPDLVTREKDLLQRREAWLDKLTRSLDNAKQYFELVSNTQFKLEGQRVKIRELMDPKVLTQLEVGVITRHDILIRVNQWSAQAKWVVVDSPKLPLTELPLSEFVKLAAVSWGGRSAETLNLIQGSFMTFLLRLSTAASLLERSDSDDARFLRGEFARLEKLRPGKMIRWTLDQIRKMVTEDSDLAAARALYQKLQRAYGATEEFQRQIAEYEDVLSKL